MCDPFLVEYNNVGRLLTGAVIVDGLEKEQYHDGNE